MINPIIKMELPPATSVNALNGFAKMLNISHKKREKRDKSEWN